MSTVVVTTAVVLSAVGLTLLTLLIAAAWVGRVAARMRDVSVERPTSAVRPIGVLVDGDAKLSNWAFDNEDHPPPSSVNSSLNAA